jgi:transketolase
MLNALKEILLTVSGIVIPVSSEQLLNALSTTSDKPIFVLANTIKGNGIKSIENKHEWHHKTPNKEQYELFMEEIEEIRFQEFLMNKSEKIFIGEDTQGVIIKI